MVKFLELTDFDDQPLMVNVANIIWIRPYEEENGTLLYVTSLGKNDYPVSICVKESYTQITKRIQN